MRRALERVALTDRPRAASEPALQAGDDILLDPVPATLLADWAASYPELRDELAALTLWSVMIVPLRASGRTLGLMFFSSLSPERRFDRDDLGLARELADRVAQALENARLLVNAQRAQSAAEVAAHDLRAAQRRFSSAFANAPIGMALVSARDGLPSRIDDVNPAFSELTGFSQDELLGRDLIDELVHPSSRQLAISELERLASGAVEVINGESRLLRKGGADVWVQISFAPLGRVDGASELVVQVQDISDRKRHEGELRYLADHDPLTGLVNRRRFVEELGRMAASAYRHGVATALLVLDVDHFKYVNDTYGHGTGDDVLTAIARILEQRTRDTDVVGRLGGDEFGIILSHSSGRDAHSVALSLLHELRDDRSTIVNDHAVSVTASIGLRAVERGDGLTADELIVEADIAMYDAKETGRNRVSVAGSDSIEPTRLRRRLAMSDRIRRALARDDGFVLYEQPICALATGEVDRTEILVRMPDGEGDLLPPSSFLPIADHFSLMPAVDQWVIVHAIELLAKRQKAGIRLGMEVNLSGTSIGDPAVIDFIAASVRSAGIDPTALTFEVTETEAIVNIDRARVLSRQLSSLGCAFALDDFGAGFGSFYYLKHLPFDVVKIDGDFIKSLPTSTSDQLTVQAIVTIARGLSKRTVAEFVGDDRTIGAAARVRGHTVARRGGASGRRAGRAGARRHPGGDRGPRAQRVPRILAAPRRHRRRLPRRLVPHRRYRGRGGGSYRILGRSSVDIIKTGGFKVSALEIEEELRTHPAIAECAVVGIPDEDWGERISAAVELAPGAELTLDALQAWSKERLAPYKVPRALRSVAALPRNAMGKVLKTEVAKLFAAPKP